MVSALTEERAERIRSQERADIAAHLHDSVLQTLALIQRNADSPREVARLARGQERELRDAALRRPHARPAQLAEQLRAGGGRGRGRLRHRGRRRVVGDARARRALARLVGGDPRGAGQRGQARRASAVSLYAEVEDDAASASFVKDRGVGFDPDGVAEDRQGVRGSIVGRVERHGGTVTIRTRARRGHRGRDQDADDR